MVAASDPYQRRWTEKVIDKQSISTTKSMVKIIILLLAQAHAGISNAVRSSIGRPRASLRLECSNDVLWLEAP
ncbi:hypothetical protein E2562_017331 [Oryza meyeriana var. granulata]|uniref:Uncharacterized protein n=1 Tax=Oryza meyeriana var. granulata TaxID=110450 RepID=A0A6G1BXL2_9ORYZ|nr:hypothetical protein E2562_017331 [Oryza meyeriana var. granulata]